MAVVHTDSQFVANGCNDWLPGWKEKGWRRSNKKPVANIELWQRIDSLLSVRPKVRIEWIRSHSGNFWNDRADKLAKDAAGNSGLVQVKLTIDGVVQ